MESALPLQSRCHVDASRAMSEVQCNGSRAWSRKSNQRDLALSVASWTVRLQVSQDWMISSAAAGRAVLGPKCAFAQGLQRPDAAPNSSVHRPKSRWDQKSRAGAKQSLPGAERFGRVLSIAQHQPELSAKSGSQEPSLHRDKPSKASIPLGVATGTKP